MRILTYTFIFLSKIIENALGTLRLIVVANGKKMLGSILQFIISIIWILVTSAVVINVGKDPLKVFFFCMGSAIGSYLGSILEEKIALGDSLITCITNNDNIYKTLDIKGYNLTKLKDDKTLKNILLITTPRKKKHHIFNIIKDYDVNATIISENVKLTK